MLRSEAMLRDEMLILVEILRSAATGVFPGPVLETLIDRLEARR